MKSRFQNVLPGGFEPVTPRSIVQCGTTEPTTAAVEPDSNLCYLWNNVDYAAINFCHNHPPHIPGDLHKKLAPTLALLHPSFYQGAGREFVGVVPKGRAFSTKLFLPFLEFSSLWQKSATDNTLGFICCSEIAHTLKTMPAILDSIKDILIMRNSLIVSHLILRALWKICLYKLSY